MTVDRQFRRGGSCCVCSTFAVAVELAPIELFPVLGTFMRCSSVV